MTDEIKIIREALAQMQRKIDEDDTSFNIFPKEYRAPALWKKAKEIGHQAMTGEGPTPIKDIVTGKQSDVTPTSTTPKSDASTTTSTTPKADTPEPPKPTGSVKTNDKPVSVVKTKGGDYNVYAKGSEKAADFRKAYAAAKGNFEWEGRKYAKPSSETSKPATSTDAPLPPSRPANLSTPAEPAAAKPYKPASPERIHTSYYRAVTSNDKQDGIKSATPYARMPLIGKTIEPSVVNDLDKKSTTSDYSSKVSQDFNAVRPQSSPQSSSPAPEPKPLDLNKPESESGGKKKKMSEETNPLIAAFLKLQSENPSNMFEAAKKLSPKQKAKMDVDKDNDIDANDLSALRAGRKGNMEEDNIDPVITGSSSVTKSKTGYVDPSTPTQPYTKAPMSTGAGDVIDKAKGALDKKGVREAYMQVLEGKKARERREDGYGYDRHGNLKNPEDKYDDNNERIPAKNSGSSSSDETNDIIKGSAPMKGLQNAGGYGAGEASDPGGRKDKEINDMLKGSAPMKGLVHSGGYGAGEASDPGGRKEKEINDLIKGSAPIKGLVHSGGYSGAAGIYGGNPPKERPVNIPKGEYEYFPGMKKDPKGLSYRAVDEAKKARTEDGISGSAPMKGLVNAGGYGAGEASDPGGRKAAETNAVLRGSAPIAGLQHSGGYDAVQRGEHLYKYNLSTGEKIPGGNAEMPAGWSPKTSGKSNWEKSKEWEPTPTTSKADAEKQQKWDAYKKTLKPLPKDMPEEVEFSQAEIDHLNSFFLEASVAPNRPEVARGADSTSDKMSQNDVTGTAESGGKKKIKEEVELEEGMPASVIASKQKYAEMSDEDFAAKHGHKSEKELRDMAARHGYGWNKETKTGSDHYVKRVAAVNKTNEEVIQEGRPKKNPTPETTERDPRKHIQVEAGRAAAGNVIDFHHNDGSKSKITPAMGRRIVAHFQGLKPADRQAAVNKMHDSPEGLKV